MVYMLKTMNIPFNLDLHNFCTKMMKKCLLRTGRKCLEFINNVMWVQFRTVIIFNSVPKMYMHNLI